MLYRYDAHAFEGMLPVASDVFGVDMDLINGAAGRVTEVSDTVMATAPVTQRDVPRARERSAHSSRERERRCMPVPRVGLFCGARFMLTCASTE